MGHIKTACQHPSAAHGFHWRTRFASLFVLFVLCLGMGWGLDAPAAAAAVAAADCTTPGFGPPTVYNVGATRAFAPDDFDGDGNTDLAVVNSTLFGTLSLLFGDGTGAFPIRSSYVGPKGRGATAIATGDFDGDGKPDIVIANEFSIQGEATVYLNEGLFFNREILLFWTSQGTHTSTASVAVADFNADGKLDIVTTNPELHHVGVAFGDGTGRFTNLRTFNSGGTFPVHVAARDLNSDGKVDLAVSNSGGTNSVSIFLGDGAGNFGTPTPFAAGSRPIFTTTGDFNSDNKIDLAIVPLGGVQYISILYGDGAGAFSAPSNVAVSGPTPANLAVADFNGDGKSDIALGRPGDGVPTPSNGNAAILLGDGAGNFSLITTPFTAGSVPGFVHAPDLNRDGKPDLVGIGGGGGSAMVVLLNRCGATKASLSFNTPLLSVSETANTVTLTVIRNGSLDGAVSVNYATLDNTAFSPGDYKATSGTLTFADGEASKTFSVELVNDTLDESQQAFLVFLSQPSGTAVLGGLNAARVNINDDDPTPVVSVSDATVSEGEGRATITVTRTSDTSGAITLDYRTQDTDNFTVGCADTVNNHGSAYARCDFATTIGRLEFAAGQSQKTFTIPIIDDGHDEGLETFGVVVSNPERTGAGTTFAATVTLTDNDDAGARNPIITRSPADYPFFVRQQYLDFLSREPEPSEPWTAVMNRCPNVNTPPSAVTDCDRIAVSRAFFAAPEFNLKGLYAFRFYKVAFRRLPQYGEIVADMSFLAGATEAEVYARRAQLATSFVARQEFIEAYGSISNDEYLIALMGRYQLIAVTTPDPAAPDGTTKVTFKITDLQDALNAGTLSRAQVLRAVADSDEVAAREYNSAFVAAQYYGYLRRTPEDDGYRAWLRVINEDPNNVRIMVNGFLNSTEYRLRFGQQ